jgi:hypothetical protein
MKNLLIFLITLSSILLFTCKKDEVSARFKLLTGPTWKSDSLLADGIDASGSGGILEKFNGEAKFNADGTGVFGIYTGTWKFATNETEIIISSDSLKIPQITTQIVELSNISLKITTGFPNMLNLSQPIKIRMTFTTK